jgi:hypothetical protein
MGRRHGACLFPDANFLRAFFLFAEKKRMEIYFKIEGV